MRLKLQKAMGPRLYTNGRGVYPSVSEILKCVEKPYFDRWRHKVGHKEADKVMETASVFGTKLHAIAQRFAWGERGDVEPEMKPYADAVGLFLDNHVAEVLGTEVELISEKHLFGGTLDLHCRLKDGSYAVVDYKTTASLTREHGLQTAAYALLLREHGMRVNRRVVVRIKKDKPGSYYMRHYIEHQRDVEAFLGLRTYWHWQHRGMLEKRIAARNSGGRIT